MPATIAAVVTPSAEQFVLCVGTGKWYVSDRLEVEAKRVELSALHPNIAPIVYERRNGVWTNIVPDEGATVPAVARLASGARPRD